MFHVWSLIITLLALDFYDMIVDSGFALINYHLIESRARNLFVNYDNFIQVWIIVQLVEDKDSKDEVRLLGGIPLILSLIQYVWRSSCIIVWPFLP